MDSLFFKCSCCKNYIKMKRKVLENFSDWAYYGGIEWSDFSEDVPDFSEKNWSRSETIPVVNENHTLYVCKPFDESIGNEFWILFQPALCYFNGWDEVYESEIDKCAIVRCKLSKILKRNEYEAWIVVRIQEVVLLNELYNYFKPCVVNKDINIFDGIPENTYQLLYKNKKWLVTYWNSQGDCGEDKWIYTDDNGVRHLVMQSWFDFDQSILYIGNIIRSISNEQN